MAIKENFCETTLLLHFQNCRYFTDTKDDDTSDVDRLRKNPDDFSQENVAYEDKVEQPECIEVLSINPIYDDGSLNSLNFSCADSGLDHDWSATSL